MLRPIILLVDDSANDQFLVKSAFKHSGISDPVYVANDGTEAAAYLQGMGQYANRDKFPFPTVLLIDLKMPKMNGFELLRFLKNNPHLVVIPTIVFTSSTDPDDIAKAYQFGANSYMVKPNTLARLCEHLKVMHIYWTYCEVPAMDKSGHLLPTHNTGKLSEKVPKHMRKDK